jgi:hypothetical protein
MNPGIKWRLTGLGLGVGLMGGLIVLATLESQLRTEATRARLSQVDLESFRIADRFKDKLRAANDQMRRYGSTEDPAAWEEFLKASQELKYWIASQGPRLTTALERKVLKQMDSACLAYTQKARELHDRLAKDGRKGASLAEYNDFFQYSRHFMDLSQDLARIHYESHNEVLTQADRTLTQLNLLVFLLVGLLLLFGVALAVGVYRYLIAPLRIQLVESLALAEHIE